jgi:hypothetical protein
VATEHNEQPIWPTAIVKLSNCGRGTDLCRNHCRGCEVPQKWHALRRGCFGLCTSQDVRYRSAAADSRPSASSSALTNACRFSLFVAPLQIHTPTNSERCDLPLFFLLCSKRVFQFNSDADHRSDYNGCHARDQLWLALRTGVRN